MWQDKKEIEYHLCDNIARVLSQKGDFVNAAEYAKKSVELAKMVYGESSVEVSTLKKNWAIYLINSKRIDEAESLLEEVLFFDFLF
jgi:putative IMPACT (imprinted ancient) family translation regulator